MESFVKEPTIDWLHSARIHNPNDSICSSGKIQSSPGFFFFLTWIEICFILWNADSDWEPAMRIRIAERKLDGANPKDIFAEELQAGQIRK